MGDQATRRGPLDGLRVLEIGHYVAGPYCTKLLADFGADVIKIERPGLGDGARQRGPFPPAGPHPERSASFLALNSNKRSVTLDLKSRSGLAIARRLVAWAEVLVENLSPGAMERLSLGYKQARALNHRLVMASISNFGQTGPYRDFKADSMIEYALGGYMYVTGEPDREPVVVWGDQPAFQAAQYAVMAILTALFYREGTGRGQHLDVSLLECLPNMDNFALPLYNAYGYNVRRTRGECYVGEFFYPFGPMRCRDGYVCPAVVSPEQWAGWCVAADRPELIEDPRYVAGPDRADRAEELNALFGATLASLSRDDVFRRCQELQVPCAKVLSVAELLDDPQYRARAYWVEANHPAAGRLTFPGAPWKMAATPWRSGRAPLLGEHTVPVLQEVAGLSGEEVARLRQVGVV